jgi:cadmium resistance protein CadD (predicted permease)
VAFDFRGEAEQMGRLKTLPIPAWTLALAEVAGSAIVTLGFQVLLLTALVVFAGLAPTYALVAFAGYVPVTIGLLAAANLAHLLAPKATFLTFLLQMGFLVANALVHVLATLGLLSIGASGIGVFVPLFVLQVAVTGSVLWLVGKAFDRYDVSSSTR